MITREGERRAPLSSAIEAGETLRVFFEVECEIVLRTRSSALRPPLAADAARAVRLDSFADSYGEVARDELTVRHRPELRLALSANTCCARAPRAEAASARWIER